MKVLCISLISLMLSLNAYADMYQTTTEDGTVLYTNIPASTSQVIMKEKKSERKVSSKPVKKKNSGDYHGIAEEKAKKHNIDPKLVKAVINAESKWNPKAVSSKGALGIMQLMPKTASDMGVGNPFSPEENIEGGVKYLKYLLDKFNGNLTFALAAYNAGPTKVERVMGVPSIPETVNYVRRVMNDYSGGSAAGRLSRGSDTKIRVVTLEDGTVLFTNAYNPGSPCLPN